MKRLACVILMLLGVLLAGAGGVLKVWQHKTSPQALIAAVQEEFSERLEGSLTIGNMSLAAGSELTARGIEFSPPGEGGPLLTCEGVSFVFDRWGLITGRRAPRRAFLLRPELMLRYNEQEQSWNFEHLGKRAPDKREPVTLQGVLREGLLVRDASVSIESGRLFPDTAARRISGINLRVVPDDPSSELWSVSGGVREGLLSGTTIAGSFKAGDQADFSLRLESDTLRVDEDLLSHVPGVGRGIWALFRPRGPVGYSATLRSSPEGGSLDYSARLKLRGIEMLTKWFPAPLTSVAGMLQIGDNMVIFDGVSGLLEPEALGLAPGSAPPARVSVDGVYQMKPAALTLRVDGTDITLCRKTVEAIPQAGSRVWEEFKPEGLADFNLRLDGSEGEPHLRFATRTRLKGATLTTRYFPAPLEGVTGNVEVDSETVTFRDVVGTIRPDALDPYAAGALPVRVRLGGTLNLKTQDLLLTAEAQDVPLCRKTVEAIPQVGAKVWDELRPQGPVDLSLRISIPGGGGEEWFTGEVRLKGAGLTARQLPLPLANLTGRLLIDPDGITFSNVTGLLPQESGGGGAAHVSISGLYDFTGTRTRLAVQLRNLEVDEQIVHATPGLGRDLWELLRPVGRVDATLLLSSAGDEDGLSVSGSVEIRSGRSLLEFCPIPVVDLSGTVHVDGATVRFVDLSGRLVSEESSDSVASPLGYVTINGAMDVAANKGTFQLEVGNLFVIDGFLHAIPLPAATADVLITCRAIGWRLTEELPEIERVVRPGGTALHLYGVPHPAPDGDEFHHKLLARGYQPGTYREGPALNRKYWKQI